MRFSGIKKYKMKSTTYFFAVLLFVMPFLSSAQIKAKKTNVLLIVVDDLNTSLGCYGNKQVKTPNIDRLASMGVMFDRAYCQYPLCNPSRVSFLSGKRPENTGVYVLNVPARKALPDAVLLPQYFKNQGYFTAGAGKVFHNAKMSDELSWNYYTDEASIDAEEKAAIDTRYGGGDGRPKAYVLTTDGSKTRDGLNTKTIKDLLAAKKDQPFFLAAGFHKPHLPWTAPKKYFDLYPVDKIQIREDPKMINIPAVAMQTELSGFAQPDSRAAAIQGYYACISFTDAHVGELMEVLDREKLWENTVVVLVGDNGFHLGDHEGLWAKLSAFDASTRVPFIMAGAGIPKGKVLDQPVELLDLYPTLLSLTGEKDHSKLDGKSLLPYMQGKNNSSAYAKSLVFHYDPKTKSDVMGQTLIHKDWRYTDWGKGEKGSELYIRKNDPFEFVNRIQEKSFLNLKNDAHKSIQSGPIPKPGESNRPRALLEPGMVTN